MKIYEFCISEIPTMKNLEK